MTSGAYYVSNTGHIFGPNMTGEFYVREGRIYGRKHSGEYCIRNNHIFGPDDRLPWLED